MACNARRRFHVSVTGRLASRSGWAPSASLRSEHCRPWTPPCPPGTCQSAHTPRPSGMKEAPQVPCPTPAPRGHKGFAGVVTLTLRWTRCWAVWVGPMSPQGPHKREGGSVASPPNGTISAVCPGRANTRNLGQVKRTPNTRGPRKQSASTRGLRGVSQEKKQMASEWMKERPTACAPGKRGSHLRGEFTCS